MRTSRSFDRRTFALQSLALASAAFAAPRAARATDTPLPDHERMDLSLPGSPRLAQRATVLVPKGCPATSSLPVLTLLHGLGETHNVRDGVNAWAERYGLLSSYARLLRPPVASGLRRLRYLVPERAQQLDRELAARPFQGMIIVCPFTPNVFKMHTARALDDYAAWLVDVLLPEVRRRTPASSSMRATGLAGCSLGGFVSFEVFQRRPEAFFTCGGVQAAIGPATGDRYARNIASLIQRHGPRRIHVETSSGDPYHNANVAFARALAREGVEHALRDPPGPHNQPWLQEIGTLEMLLWHDRQLRGAESKRGT